MEDYLKFEQENTIHDLKQKLELAKKKKKKMKAFIDKLMLSY